jgi:hypothetical protein
MSVSMAFNQKIVVSVGVMASYQHKEKDATVLLYSRAQPSSKRNNFF